MIIEPCCDEVSNKQQLPTVSVESMTQVQLLEFIPRLLTLATGHSAKITEKPKWWPESLPWDSSLNQFTNQDEVGVEILREVIRCCYKYLGQENLLSCPNFPADMKPLPSSPQTADSHLKATEPNCVKKENKEEQSAEPTDILKSRIVNQSGISEQLADENEVTEEIDVKHESTEESGFVKEEILEHVESQSINTNGEGLLNTSGANISEEENIQNAENQLESSDLKDEVDETEEGRLDSAEANGTEKEEKSEKQEDDVVWICFICAKGFSNQKDLMTHQDSCEDSSEDPSLIVDNESVAAVQDKTDPDFHTSEQHQPAVSSSRAQEQNIISELQKPVLAPSFYVTPVGLAKISSNSPFQQQTSLLTSGGFSASLRMPVLASHMKMPTVAPDIVLSPNVTVPSTRPVPALLTKVGSQYKSLPLGLPLIRKRKRKKWPDIYIPPPPDTYFNGLGLGPTPKVKEIQDTPKKADRDCEVIDLTLEEVQPVTPRTPKSLISQWSREEASGRRRQLSFNQNSVPNKEKEESSSESDSSESSKEEKVPKRNAPCKSTLYAIPLTSPLGQRLKKNWQHEDHVPVVSDIEQYCRTRFSPITKGVGGNDVMDKLRNRPPPQVTFRFTKKYLNKYFHSYKFTSDDKREFEKKVRTGLEKESRRRLRQMKPCKVVLRRISKKDIKYWTTRGQKRRYNMYEMQDHLKQKILLEQQKLQRARFSQGFAQNQRFRPVNSFQFQNPPYGMPRPQYLTQTRFVSTKLQGPTPRLLVAHGSGIVGMPLVSSSDYALLNQYSSQPSQPMATVKRELTGSQKRKQDFSNLRVDDEISIISLSSDEDEEADKRDESKNCKCIGCQQKSNKGAIHKKPRIGPASFKQREALKQRCIYAGSASQIKKEKIQINAQRNDLDRTVCRTAVADFTGNIGKRAEFMKFRMVNGQIQDLKTANVPLNYQNTTSNMPNILNRSIINRPFIQSKPGSPASVPGSPTKGPCSPIKAVPGSPDKGPCSPIKLESGAHVEKNDMLGYEVIMIDSDDDD